MEISGRGYAKSTFGAKVNVDKIYLPDLRTGVSETCKISNINPILQMPPEERCIPHFDAFYGERVKYIIIVIIPTIIITNNVQLKG